VTKSIAIHTVPGEPSSQSVDQEAGIIGNPTSVVYPKFVEKFQTMTAAQGELKSPFVPLFSKGDFLRGL
jgi:hypothetical protein